MRHPLAIAIASATAIQLTACVPYPAPELQPDPVENACKAQELQGLVMQPASVLETMRFRGPLRIIRPGMAVTMDFSPERLNIEINDEDRIARVYCS